MLLNFFILKIVSLPVSVVSVPSRCALTRASQRQQVLICRRTEFGIYTKLYVRHSLSVRTHLAWHTACLQLH